MTYKGRVRTLVATDIAARGIDVDGITHVINFDLPHVPDTYVHRIGRTGRAGADGTAVSLCDASEVALLRDIEKLIRKSIAASGQRPSPPSARHAAERAGGRARSAQPSHARRNGRNAGATVAQPQENAIARVAFLNNGGGGDSRQQFRKRRRRKRVQFGRA